MKDLLAYVYLIIDKGGSSALPNYRFTAGKVLKCLKE